MRPKPTARAEESLRFGHDLVLALRAMPGANPVPDTIRVPEVRQTQIAYKSYRTAIGAVVAPRRIAASARALRVKSRADSAVASPGDSSSRPRSRRPSRGMDSGSKSRQGRASLPSIPLTSNAHHSYHPVQPSG